MWMPGKKKIARCACCGSEVEQYLPLSDYFLDKFAQYRHPWQSFEMCNAPQYACPVCGAADRDRCAALGLRRLLPEQPREGYRLLHIAPSAPVAAFLQKNYPWIEVKTADLFMPGMDLKLDITHMPEVPDNSYDALICIHVLEHVSSDRKALREFYRILKPGGFGICVVPISLTQRYTDEELGLTEEENWVRFGQNDHVRMYEHGDYVFRLQQAGFTVEQLGRKEFGAAAFAEQGLQKTAVLYVVHKPQD